jgi:hypothetical protein
VRNTARPSAGRISRIEQQTQHRRSSWARPTTARRHGASSAATSSARPRSTRRWR